MNFVAQQQRADAITTVPSPVGGLNAFDNLAAMPITDAVVLTNLVPQPYGCSVRKGYIEHATTLSESVDSLAHWNSRDGSVKFFAWSGSDFYDITASGVAAAPLITTLTGSWWQFIQMGNSAGVHMVAFNGLDDGIWYSEAGLQRLTLGDGIVVGTWNGLDPKSAIQATVHQHRIWVAAINDTQGWYLPDDQVYGDVTPFDFGPFFKRGGYLSTVATWTVDSGAGADDLLVAISSAGEAVVFKGTNPSDPTAWSLVGVFYIGQPVRGRRYLTNVAGDLYVLTATGIVSMATMLTSTQVNVAANNTYSRKIQFLLSDLTSDLGDVDGWQLIFFPAINLLFVNVPTVYSGGSGQIVANHITTAWCTFSGMDAKCWNNVDGLPYFGDPDGNVFRAWFADRDAITLDGTGGTDILSAAQQAFNYLGAPAAQKQLGMYRANFVAVSRAGYASGIIYDFKTSTIGFANPSTISGAAALWGDALWGEGLWGGGLITQRDWRQAQGIGVAFAIRLNMSTSSEVTWVSTDYTYRKGGAL